MPEFQKLELSTETIRDLTREELAEVAGGAAGISGLPCNFTPVTEKYCPSGYTWTANCNIDTFAC